LRFQNQWIVDPAMKTGPRPWNAEEHRQFVATCFQGIALVIHASGKPLLAIGLIVALVTEQPIHLLQFLRSLF
jgi:hypothetical protein